jgi:hypothetical protein
VGAEVDIFAATLDTWEKAGLESVRRD